MSIKKEMIEMHAYRTKKEPDIITLEARLQLVNRKKVTRLILSGTKDQKQMLEMAKAHEEELRKSMIHYIYSDLLEPINDLAILAQHHLTGMNDADELKELKDKINSILKGL